MAAPTLLTVYPSDGSTGLPIGESLRLDFDRGVDLVTVKDFIVLFGNDFDKTSGPESAVWIDQDTGNNPYYLRSPGFKGLVELSITSTYYDIDTDADITLLPLSEADETSYGVSGAGHRIYITPSIGQLAPDTEYQLNVFGDPSSLGTGVSSRTVFETEPDAGNASTTGTVHFTGPYTGTTTDSITLEITTAGDIGTAKYKWYFTSAGSGTAVYDKLSNRRYRNLAQGVQVRFSGEGFALGDVFVVNVEPAQRLAANTKITFTTNDGSYTAAPDSPSIPATSEPPDTVIPPVPGESTSGTTLQVVEMLPPDGSFNISNSLREITILFDDTLQASTVTADTVRLYKYPVLGYWQGQAQPVELQKRLSVSGQILTIQF